MFRATYSSSGAAQTIGILRVCYVWFHSNPGSSQHTYHVSKMPIVFCAAPPEDEEVVLETCRGLNL
jgi:hypothetical protein